jgi:hypothetical protein
VWVIVSTIQAEQALLQLLSESETARYDILERLRRIFALEQSPALNRDDIDSAIEVFEDIFSRAREQSKLSDRQVADLSAPFDQLSEGSRIAYLRKIWGSLQRKFPSENLRTSRA